MIYEQPSGPGQERVLLHEDINSAFDVNFPLSAVEGALIYGINPAKPGGDRAIELHIMQYKPPIGRHAIAALKDVRRAVLTTELVNEPPVRVRRFSLRDGSVHDLVRVAHGSNACVQQDGQNLYWIRSGPDRHVRAAIRFNQPNLILWEEVIGHSDLMVTSLVDGSTRLVRAGLTRSTQLIPGTGGVFWHELQPWPNRSELYYYQASSDRAFRLNADMGIYSSYQAPVEYRGRLYWFANEPHSDPQPAAAGPGVMPGGAYTPMLELVSTKPDGSDRRTVFSMRQPGWDPSTHIDLMVYHGALYGKRFATGPDSQTHLYRLHPDRSDVLEKVCTLPFSTTEITLDGGYIYFVLHEPQRSLWDRLTASNYQAAKTAFLYRIRLPQ